jgi:Resolvase, N terminal domain
MTTPAVIYARFSTDHQDERSTEDQVALCRDYARREGLHVVEVFEDRARSGASYPSGKAFNYPQLLTPRVRQTQYLRGGTVHAT